MKQLNGQITKDSILKSIDQVDIFAKYLNIDPLDIKDCIVYNTLIPSPIRDNDTKGSVGFKYNNKGRLKMRDFGGYFWGDCFDLVAYVLSTNGNRLNISNPNTFQHILNHVADTFSGNNTQIITKDLIHNIEVVKRTKKIFAFEPRSWNSTDYKIWIDKFHKLFTVDFLSANYVYPVERIWIDPDSQPEAKYYHTSKDPCYAYYGGQDANNISNIRFYFPLRGKSHSQPKFISNNEAIQGILDLEDKYDYVVITKSYKDVLVLRRLFSTFSFTGDNSVLVIAYPSENYIITNRFIEWVLSKLRVHDVNRVFHFLDFDKTGRKTTRIGYSTFGIRYTFLTNGMFGLPNYGAKDISEFLTNFGIRATVTIINDFIKNNFDEYDAKT